MNPISNTYILDSYALLAYLGNEAGRDRVEELLRQSKDGETSLLLCMMNFGEVLYITERHRGLVTAQKVQALIENMPIQIIDPDRNLILDAAHIKANHPLSYADAFVVAIARQENGIIVSGDPEFKSVEEMVAIEWLGKE